MLPASANLAKHDLEYNHMLNPPTTKMSGRFQAIIADAIKTITTLATTSSLAIFLCECTTHEQRVDTVTELIQEDRRVTDF